MLEHYSHAQVMHANEADQPRQSPVMGADDEADANYRAAMPQRELNLMQDEGADIYQQAPVAHDLGAPKPWAQYRENNWMIALAMLFGGFILYGTFT